MCESFIRRGIFKAVLKGAPTYLGRADETVNKRAIEKLTAGAAPQWSEDTIIDNITYNIWLHHLNSSQRYGVFSNFNNTLDHRPLSKIVQKTKRITIFGKAYTSNSELNEGNSLVEYCVRGKQHVGHIQYAFRSKDLNSVFLLVSPFVELNAEQSTRNIYLSHPRLHAGMALSELGASVVVDTQDLIGHIVVVKNPPGHLGIDQETISYVSLRNIVSVSQSQVIPLLMTS